MKKYYIIALTAITAIMVLLIGNIKGRFDSYVQEVSENIDKAFNYAVYRAQNEAYNVGRRRKTRKAVYLHRVA